MILNKVIDNIKTSFFRINSNYSRVWILVSIEIMFFIIYGIIYGVIINNGVANNLSELAGKVITQQENFNDNLLSSVVQAEQFNRIVIMLLVFALISYILYGLFQGYIWGKYINLSGPESHGGLFIYMKRFFSVNIVWSILFAIAIIIDFLFSYIDTVGKRIEPNGVYFLSKISLLLFIIIGYFAFISYVFLKDFGAWKSICMAVKIGIKKIHWMLLTFGIIGLILMISEYFSSISNYWFLAGFIAAIIAISFIGKIKAFVISALIYGTLSGIAIYLIFKLIGIEIGFGLIFVGMILVMPILGWSRVFLSENVLMFRHK